MHVHYVRYARTHVTNRDSTIQKAFLVLGTLGIDSDNVLVTRVSWKKSIGIYSKVRYFQFYLLPLEGQVASVGIGR